MNLPKVSIRSIRSFFTRPFRRRTTEPVETFDPQQANSTPEFVEEVIKIPPAKLLKGRLRDPHRRILMGQKPYDGVLAPFHNTIKYKRRLLGQYGIESSGVVAGIAWPTVEEVASIMEYEKVAYPKTLQEQWQDMEEREKKIKEHITLREAELEANMLKVEKWKEELHAKIQKKKYEVEEAQKKKAKVVEEIRRHFGYCISVHDERFQKLLQEKEEQEKRKRKEDKKRMKMERKAQTMQKTGERLGDDELKSEPALNKNKEEKIITDVMEREPDDMKNN